MALHVRTLKNKISSIRFVSRVGRSTSLPGMHYLEIPVHVVEKLGGSFKCRVICNLEGRLRFQAGLVALGAGKAFIMLSKARMGVLGISLGDRVKVELKLDQSRYGAPLPKELKELLRQDEDGHRRFRALTPGKQRSILKYVDAVKNPDRRLERAIFLIENLKRTPPGRESFREILGLPRLRPNSK